MRRADSISAAGFTLVEVLVALVAAAILLSVIFAAVANADTRGRLVADRSRAMMLAEAALQQDGQTGCAVATEQRAEGTLTLRISHHVEQRDPRNFFVLCRTSVLVSGRQGTPLYEAHQRALLPLAGGDMP